jgi:hypothetical protein
MPEGYLLMLLDAFSTCNEQGEVGREDSNGVRDDRGRRRTYEATLLVVVTGPPGPRHVTSPVRDRCCGRRGAGIAPQLGRTWLSTLTLRVVPIVGCHSAQEGVQFSVPLFSEAEGGHGAGGRPPLPYRALASTLPGSSDCRS